MLKPMRSVATATIGGLPVVDLAVALALSAYAVVDVGVVRGRGVAAAGCAVALTLPVAWCRRAPLGAAAALAAGGVANAVLFPHIVRCGFALPAVFIVAFFVGARCDRARAAAGLALCAANVTAQGLSDPRLGTAALGLLLPIFVAFFALGRVFRSRTAAVEVLRRRTEELERQREETTRMTVLADRARVAEDIDAELRGRIARIAGVAREAGPGALAAVEREGRAALQRMREIVAEPGDAGPLPHVDVAEEHARGPLAAGVAASAVLLAAGAFAAPPESGPATLLLVVPLWIAYLLGARVRSAPGLACAVLMSVALQASSGGGFNPLFEMITVGPWLAGLAVRSRRRLAMEIDARNRELEAAKALYALEAVRYERARIARELHDIVAHCVTVVVVQAAAARRLPERESLALASVAEATRDAELEIARLNDRLDHADPLGVPMIETLALRTAATGLHVEYRPAGDLRNLRPPASEVAYRVVQESLTNAMRHAPGAPVEIAVREEGAAFAVEVRTGAPRRGSSGLETSGGGRGLAGMRRRVASCGGTLVAGPTADGGWRVSARLPSRTVARKTLPVSAV